MDNFDRMSRAPVFEGIDHDDIEALCACGRALSFEAGHRLFDRGQDARELMILQEGTVDLLFPIQLLGVTRELTIETKEVGRVVAWSALVPPYRFTLSARCASRCVLTSMSRDALEGFFWEHSRVGLLFMRNLASVIGQRLYAMQSMWLSDLQSGARQRLG
ncbi:MAG: Crp/Fnr family transcriptional regulator [Phycisphaerae bacterium]